ncbi:tyrosine-protein kinase Shark [Frankliniella occidentalis]|uniref:Tyrosine-protein kinase n=1 Tax=Frankliniella occidentalis TaxID=133901 RepID=A0A6J1T3K7_FRAOC|nr:tyrosine-protein kinase Shark [Frankliniella occidentalis]XP_052119480.1 tyrosine-protein kinase Shark [Frankliniella occidentalis]
MSHGNNQRESINWYFGNISRIAAENELKNVEIPENGLFLVRESSSSAGDYVLSFLHNKEVFHYQIRRHGEDAFFSIDEETIIHGLDTLIEYYQVEGLDVRLTRPPRLQDPPPHTSRRHGTTNLLHRATREGNYKIVSELLKCQYRSLDAKNEDGQTAVHVASRLGQDDILKKLIESNANINCRDTAGYTPLHYACRNNKASTARILVDMGGANIQIRHTETGHVPLHEAASNGHVDVVTVLLSLNAPVNPRTVNNETPADLAHFNRFTECAKMLRDYKPPAPRSKREAWHHGTLDRVEAEDILKTCKEQEGVYLVRYSKRHSGDVLTISHRGQFFHYQIKKDNSYYFIDSGPLHNTIEHVIDYYTLLSDGLPTTLQFPVPPKPKPKPPEIPPNGLASTLPSRRNRHRLEEMIGNSTVGRMGHSLGHGLPTLYGNDPPELGIPTVATVPPLAIMHSAPLSALLSNTNSLALTSQSSPPTTLASSSLFTNNSINSHTPSVPIPRLHEPQQEHIPTEQLRIGDVLGEGEFGSVYKGVYIDFKGIEIPVAIKTLRQEHAHRNKEEFVREARVMMGLRHPCVVKLIGISYGPPLSMVQELVPLGSMLQYLLEHPDRVNPQYELRVWASQIASGMKYLEEKRFVHRDLAARNILLATRHQAKISDFGLSRSFLEKDYYKASQGGRWPIKWYAPESFNFGNFSNASDVWSFGVTLWEMFSFGQQPYGDMKGIDVTELVMRGERLQQPDRCPDDVYRIMEQCWAFHARDRPSFAQLAENFAADANYINIKELVLDSTVSLS